MRFELFQEAAEADDTTLGELDELLRRVEEGVHDLIFEDSVAIEQSRWFQSLRAHSRQLIRLLIEAQAWRGLNKPSKVLIRSAQEVLLARDVAMTPLMILVEDDASDGSLVRAAVLAYGDEATVRTWDIGSSVTPPGWTIEHSGGSGNMPRKIKERSANPGHRLLVLCDSDKKHPNDPPKREITICAKAARDSGVRPPLVLPLREAENYLPDRFWDVWLDKDWARQSYRPVVEALKSLKPDQRDHIDMKGDDRLKGSLGPLFDGSDSDNPRPEPHHITALTGIKRNLKGSGQYPETGESRMPIRRLAEFVQSGQVTATDLDQRDRVAKLRELVQSITEEL